MELQITDRSPESLIRGVRAMLDETVPPVSNLANISRLLYESFPNVLWAGFYLTEESGRSLCLGPYQGPLACTKIAFGKGVCGAAAVQQRAILVPNVHEYPGHIACSSESNSELVIPILKNGQTVAVIDLDSKCFANFTEEDVKTLTKIVEILEELF